MKYLGNGIFRAMCALLIGLLLLFNAQQMPILIVRLIGLLFLLPGIFGISTYLYAILSPKAQASPSFPLMSIGSVLLGAYLEVYPDIFVVYVVLFIGFLLLVAGINQLLTMFAQRHVSPFSWLLVLLPLLLVASGAYCLTHSGEAAGTLFKIIGATCIYYGLSDLFFILRAKHYYNIHEREQRKAEEEERRKREAEYIDFEVINTNEKEE